MQFNVIEGIEIAEELDGDDELEITIDDGSIAITKWLTKAQAEDLADHIHKVLGESKP